MNKDDFFMSRCIQLAKNGRANTAPNPMVGAVIINNDKIIGEGYHVKCGESHAEVNAIRSVKKSELLKSSTIYVSLEPCSHYGKTPPCADLIIEKGIPKIVVGCVDPFNKVSGKGIQKLRDAGRDVKVGILEKECLELNKKFILANTLNRPYIILKWAQSADGFIDKKRKDGKPILFSSPLTQMLVHKKRSEVNAILVGTRTALLDNPSLTVRQWYGKNPIRIVLDKDLNLPSNLHLFDNSIQTFVFTEKEKENFLNTKYITLDFDVNLPQKILNVLQSLQIQSIIIEGGRVTLQSFIDLNLWDEAYIEKTKIILGSGVKSPVLNNENLVKTQIYNTSIIELHLNKL